jgi:serine protease Do
MRTIVLTIFINIFMLFVVLGSFFGYIYTNRGEIFDSFAEQYIKEEQQKIFTGRGEDNYDNEEKTAFLSNDTLITSIVEQVNSAVVSIVVTKDVPIIEQYFEDFSPFGSDSFFGSPFGGGFNFQVPKYREKGTEEREIGGGSGFFVSPDGLVVTNRHVVADKDASYTVLTNSGEKFEAEVLAKDSFLDIAIVKVKGKDFPYLSFGNSSNLKLGQSVIAIGNALGEFRNSVSVGVVSGLSRSVVAGDGRGGSEILEEVIQTDAAINPGNSGGPLLDVRGNVVGVNVAVAQGSENIGFSLPANVVSSVVTSVKRYGEIIRPYLGVRYVLVTKAMQEKNALSYDYGALLLKGETPEDLAVIPGSPADKAGLQENDIILEIDGEKITEKKSLASHIRKKAVGDIVKLKLLHKGEEKTLRVTLERAP